MFTIEDKQTLLDMANTIESGLCRVADAIPSGDDNLSEVAEAVRYAGERIEHGLVLIAGALDRHLPE